MSLTQGLHRAVQQHPGRIAVRCLGREQTFLTLADRVARLAGALQALGMQTGDRVAMLSLNSDRYFEYLLGVPWGGGVLNPVNTRWSAAEVAYSLDDCESTILIVDDKFSDSVAELRARSTRLRTVIYAGDCDTPTGMLSYEQLIRDAAPVADAYRQGEDLAGLFYTGGTTAFPKGVMLSHAALSIVAVSLVAEGMAAEGCIGLHAAPMFHLADMAFLNAMLARGSTHVMVPGFEPTLVLRTIQDEGITEMLLVPTMIQMLVDHPDVANYNLDSLRLMFYGASPISEALLDRAMQRMPNVGFLQGYGMTELAPIATALPPEYHREKGRSSGKLRSAGRASFCTEVRVVGEDGKELPRGEVGEVIVRGPNVMLGYWNKPAETAAAIRDGWMHTGDGAYMDADGFIYIVDRLKDMIVSGGENVYSGEVENAIAQHPAVASCAVIGIPSEKWGETVHAVIVLKAGQALTEADLKAHCADRIAGYKCPRSVEFRDALPLSGAGKILKRELREPYWKDRARGVG